jgi:hypothetical protein
VPDSFVEFPLERAHHLARWQELVADPELARWPGRVETDRLGRIIVSLIPALSHSFRQSDIFRALCGLDGKMEFYTADLSAASRLCPMFPGQL